MVVVVICGGGNGAHAAAGIAASQQGVESRVLTLYGNEAEVWTKALRDHEFVVQRVGVDEIKAKPSLVSKDPAVAMDKCDIILIVVPAFAHAQYLQAIKPYVKPSMILVGLPGNAGFEFAVRGILGDVAKECIVMSFESLPWACRIKEFGKCVEVLGTKEVMMGAMLPEDSKALATLQRILGPAPKLVTSGHLLCFTLMGVNGIVHPSIMYGKWSIWDGTPLDEPPLFYQGMDEASAKIMSDMSDEILHIAKELMRQRPQVDLNNVTHILQWYLRCYEHEIADSTNLYTCIRSNKAYSGLKHPTKKIEDKFVPDYGYRYMTEDIPFGLVVMKGVAYIAGTPTPTMDKVLQWAQGIMGKEYIVDGKPIGKDMSSTRAPQAFGITTIDQMLGLN